MRATSVSLSLDVFMGGDDANLDRVRFDNAARWEYADRLDEHLHE